MPLHPQLVFASCLLWISVDLLPRLIDGLMKLLNFFFIFIGCSGINVAIGGGTNQAYGNSQPYSSHVRESSLDIFATIAANKTHDPI